MSQEPIETIEVEGMTAELHYDCDTCESPRDWDNISVFAFFHRNYSNESELDSGDFGGWDEMREHIESRDGLDAICLPVYLYSHSGDTISTSPFSCPWDSGQLGFAYVTREKARNEFGWKRITKEREEKILDLIRGEVETYDTYIKGEVYGYIVKDKDGDELDSCWGYYDREDCLETAKGNAKYQAQLQREIETANSCVI
jgi:hypothetical protein